MSTQLTGKIAWITGASSGIGRACALELARSGAIVAASGRREDRLAELVAEIAAKGGEALAIVCDVRDEEQQRQAVARIVKECGRLDVAIANAGLSVGGRIDELDAAAWRRQLDTNVIGAAMTARFAIPELLRQKGRLAFTGSVAAFLPAPNFACYHCSKYALRALGRTVAVELAGSGVSTTVCHPGFVHSEINQVDNDGVFDPARVEQRPRYLLWPTERAARVIVAAIAARKRELVFTAHGKIAAFLGIHFPGLAHFVMTRGAMASRADGFRVE